MSAVLVLIAHTRSESVSYLVYQLGEEGKIYHYLAAHGHIAVMFFFVLSGYLIAYALRKDAGGEHGFKDYALDRFSRIYSVLPSAIALTLVLDLIGRAHAVSYANPALYPQKDFIYRLIGNLFSLQGIFGHRIQLGSNPALWSIGYEVWFYVAAGLIYYRRSLFRRSPKLMLAGVLGLMAIVAGWEMSAYFLIWGIGYLIFVLYHVKRIRLSRFLFVPCIGLLLFANHWLEYRNPWAVPPYLADLAIACCFGGLLLCDTERMAAPFLRLNRYLADFSYSIYAYHMPIIFFWFAVLPLRFHRALHPVESGTLAATAVLVIARLLYRAFESRRRSLRDMAEKLVTYAR